MGFVDWFMASFLYCFPYSYRSSNYCDSNGCRSFALLKALAKSNGYLFAIARARKSDNYRFRDSWKSDNFGERAIKKELIQKRMQRGLRVITLQGAIEKFEWLDSTIIISYFGGRNNIFADCIKSQLICTKWIANYQKVVFRISDINMIL